MKQKKELISLKDPKSPVSEVFRTLRTNIQFMSTNKKLKTLLVTSTFPGEGKSLVTSNLAVTFAQAGKKVILIDDMIDTAGTITNAANALKERGAEEVYACCTHAVLSGPAIERIENSAIKELIVLNTITLPPEKRISKIKELTVADIFADAINRIHEGISVSKLFDIEINS